MDAFVGKWKLTSSKNFNEYMKAIGVGCCTRTCGCMNKPTTTISSKGPNNEKITIKTETCCRLTEVTFPLNHEFEEITMDNRDVRSYGTLEGGKLRICQKWDGRQTTLIREIVNGQLVLTLTAGKVVSTQIFKKAPK